MSKSKEILQNKINKLENKLKSINNTILLAESWSQQQIMPESSICMSALKDIRRIIRN